MRRRQGRRERAVRHAPRHVRAAAARVAELHGQDRGRPADVAPAGRRQLDAGVPRDLGDVGRRHRAAVRHRRRAALARLPARPADALATMPTLFIVRLFWLPRAKVAFMAAHETNSIANGALAEGIHGVRTVQSLERQHVNFELYDEKVLRQPQVAHHLGQIRAGHGADRRYADRHLDGDGDRGRRLDGAGPQPRHRRDGGVPVLHPALLRSDPLADHAVQRHAARHGVGPAHLRGARRAGRRQGQARRDRADARHGRLGRVQERHVRLPAEPAGAEECQLPRQSRRDGRAGRPDRLGQVELDGAGAPLLRRLERARCWSAATTCAT